MTDQTKTTNAKNNDENNNLIPRQSLSHATSQPHYNMDNNKNKNENAKNKGHYHSISRLMKHVFFLFICHSQLKMTSKWKWKLGK